MQIKHLIVSCVVNINMHFIIVSLSCFHVGLAGSSGVVVEHRYCDAVMVKSDSC